MHRMIRELLGIAPRIEGTCEFRACVMCTWSRTEGRSRVYAYMCVRLCMRAVYGICACPRVHTMLRIMSHRVSGSMILTCAASVSTILQLPCARTFAENHQNSVYDCISCAVSFDRCRDRGVLSF